MRHGINPALVKAVAEGSDLSHCWIEYLDETASMLVNQPFDEVVAALSEWKA